MSLSPRTSHEDIFKDHNKYDNGYPLYRQYQSPIPYVVTSPPPRPVSAEDDDEDDDDDDDDDDVISLSTIPEVPSVMAGTLSPSEYLELGTTLGKKYRQKRSRRNKAETSMSDVNDTLGI